MTDDILTLDSVSYRYPDGTQALDNCSIRIRRGARIAVLGTNGAGKTTMFLHLNGILRPSTGQASLNGVRLDYSRSGLKSLRSQVGLVFQNPDSQLFSASVREDVSFGPMNMGLTESEVRRRVEEALLAVGMTENAERPVHNLSYGQKKRVCIAGVLAMQPEVVVLDEPMAGLDATMQEELTAILDLLHKSGMTIIIATHDLDFAYGWADEAIVLQSGRLLASGNATEILTQENVCKVLGAKPLVAEINRQLSLIGIDLRDIDYMPRTKRELLQAISAQTRQEN
ncbi:MAG: ATP-binding cassette domain-containing protein [Desulfuromonadaceae bacterium]|nr:ATP-binding cassette domain-containing protein [Desulfuromonadaceae bacterium]MDD2849740.1 ATP-binding cassette domain-containing protein [Desulfuromonadaceae bacterium]MDD4130760.1 ATP-binding cassette domain-containing protein [Desulfuromonadaceae bacterium]